MHPARLSSSTRVSSLGLSALYTICSCVSKQPTLLRCRIPWAVFACWVYMLGRMLGYVLGCVPIDRLGYMLGHNLGYVLGAGSSPLNVFGSDSVMFFTGVWGVLHLCITVKYAIWVHSHCRCGNIVPPHGIVSSLNHQPMYLSLHRSSGVRMVCCGLSTVHRDRSTSCFCQATACFILLTH